MNNNFLPYKLKKTNEDYNNLSTQLAQNTSQISAISTNIKTVFSANGNGTNDDTTALSNALNSNYSTIYLPDGTYKVTNTITINSGIPKKIIGSKNTVISVQLPASQKLFNMNLNVSFENITFDFNNGSVQTALSYYESLGTINLKNLKFQNVKDMDNTTGTILVYIPNNGNTVNIDTIEFNNIQKLGNGVVTDAAGAISCIQITDGTNSAPTNGIVRNIRIIEVHNINSGGSIIFEDTAGIYPYSAYTGLDGNLVIENVYGYNFGKRLIKLDNQNTTINKVYAYSNTQDALAGIGINSNGSKVKFVISDVQMYGAMVYGITTAANNTVINNAIIDIQKPNMTGNTANAFGINISSSQVSINNVNITSERNILLSGVSATNYCQDIKISNSVLTVPTWGVTNINIPSSAPYGFKNLLLQNVTAINNATGNAQGSFIDTTILAGTSWGTRGKGLNLINCTFYGAMTNNYGIWLKYVEDINIVNYTYNNDTVTQAWYGIDLDTCKNIRIDNFVSNANVRTVITTANVDNIQISGLIANPLSTYTFSCGTTTNIKLKHIDKSKVYLGDAVSQQNAFIESDSSYGTTANRTTSAFIGDEYFDTTLSKPIRCKTSGVKEVDTLTINSGATANGNITIALNGVSYTIAVSLGDSAGTIGDKIRGSIFKQWIVSGSSGSSTVTFTKTTGGTNSAPTFTDTGTTGTTASFVVTTAGANPTWVDATGTAV